MKSFAVMMACGVLALGACSSNSQPESSDDKNAGASPNTASAFRSDVAPDDDESPADGAIEGTFAVGNGRELYIACVGTGSPTVVLEAGDGVPSAVMGDAVKAALADRMRVCSYDRANTGLSDRGATLPRRSPEVLSDLHGLLVGAEVPGPYVLVRNSAGGLLVQAYARRYPRSVSGVVSMNPVPPWEDWSERAFPSMTRDERKAETGYFGGEGSSETLDYRQISRSLTRYPPPAGVPFHMLVATVDQCDSPDDICGRSYPAYVKITRDLSEGWPMGRFTQAGSEHELYLSDPPVVAAAIEDVLNR